MAKGLKELSGEGARGFYSGGNSPLQRLCENDESKWEDLVKIEFPSLAIFLAFSSFYKV